MEYVGFINLYFLERCGHAGFYIWYCDDLRVYECVTCGATVSEKRAGHPSGEGE